MKGSTLQRVLAIMAALGLMVAGLRMATPSVAQTQPKPTPVTISPPNKVTLQTAPPSLTAALDGPTQSWKFTLNPQTAFREAEVYWEVSQPGSTFVYGSALVPTTSDAVRTWSFPQPLAYGILKVTATTRWSDHTAIKTYETTIDTTAPEGGLRCAKQNDQFKCAAVRPQNAGGTDVFFRWQYGIVGDRPEVIDQQPATIFVVPSKFNGKQIRISVEGWNETTNNWGPIYIDIVPSGESTLFLPLVTRNSDTNPPPTQTPQPTPSPSPTQPPTAQPQVTFTIGSDNVIDANMNGVDAGDTWIWYLKFEGNESAPPWTTWAFTPEVTKFTMLNISGIDKPHGNYSLRLVIKKGGIVISEHTGNVVKNNDN